MIEAIVLWNEPNNLSHWNFHLDPEWRIFAAMVKAASESIRACNPDIPIVLGGVSSCDADFLRLMRSYGVLECVDAVAIFDEETPAEIIRRIQPDVLVKGADWGADNIVGRDTVEARGGRVVRMDLSKGYSTTELIRRVRTLP